MYIESILSVFETSAENNYYWIWTRISPTSYHDLYKFNKAHRADVKIIHDIQIKWGIVGFISALKPHRDDVFITSTQKFMKKLQSIYEC